jgi:hypothetical protein
MVALCKVIVYVICYAAVVAAPAVSRMLANALSWLVDDSMILKKEERTPKQLPVALKCPGLFMLFNRALQSS